MPTDHAIAQIARAQLGLCTLDQLRRAGVTPSSVDRRVRSGQLVRHHPGVLAVAGAPHTWTVDVLAACLAAGRGAVASHRCAGHLLGWDLRLPVPIELSVPRGRRPAPRGVVVHTSGDLTRSEVRWRGPIPCTTPERTLVDLGAVAPPWVVARTLEELVGARRVTTASVRAALDSVARPGRRGAGVLRRVLDRHAAGLRVSDPALEEAFVRLCLRHRLPHPVPQYGLELAGRWRRLDLAYPARRIAVAVDGTPGGARRGEGDHDRAGDDELEEAGWLLLRLTWRQVVRSPAAVARLVATAHQQRSGAATRAGRPDAH